MVRELIIDAAAAGDVRNDISPDKIVSYWLHAIGGAGSQSSKVAV